MSESNDHDLLIEVNTKLNILIDAQNQYLNRHDVLVGRVTSLEAKDRGDSEKIRSISADVQRSLENHTRITTLEGQIGALQDEVEDLRKKSQLIDTINAIGAAAAGVVGFMFGNR